MTLSLNYSCITNFTSRNWPQPEKITFWHHLKNCYWGIFWHGCLYLDLPDWCQGKWCDWDRGHYSNAHWIHQENSWALNYTRAWALPLPSHRWRKQRCILAGDAFWCGDSSTLSIYILQFSGCEWALTVCRPCQIGFAPRCGRLLHFYGFQLLLTRAHLLLVAVNFDLCTSHWVKTAASCCWSCVIFLGSFFSCLCFHSPSPTLFFAELKGFIKFLSLISNVRSPAAHDG